MSDDVLVLTDRVLAEFKKSYPDGWTKPELTFRFNTGAVLVRRTVDQLRAQGLLHPKMDRKGNQALRKNYAVYRFWTDPEQIEATYEPRMEPIGKTMARITNRIEVRPMTSDENKAENLELWSAVEATDPAHTKKVEHRGGFTAIDAYHQIKNATAEFGPVGVGWGWDITRIVDTGETIIVSIRMWHSIPAQNDEYEFGVIGQCPKLTGSKVDPDSAKKALTDGITKGLSYLGFNADVFLGMFDDNKYVEDQRRAHDPAIQELENSDEKWLTDMEDELLGATSLTEVNDIASAHADRWREVGKRSDARGKAGKAAIDKARQKFEPRKEESDL